MWFSFIEIHGEGLHRNFAKPNGFILNNKICLNQIHWQIHVNIQGFDTFSIKSCSKTEVHSKMHYIAKYEPKPGDKVRNIYICFTAVAFTRSGYSWDIAV